MQCILVFLVLVAAAYTLPVVYTENTSRLDEVEQAVINLIEQQRGWRPYMTHRRPSGDIIKAYNKACHAENEEIIAQEKAQEARRVKEEADWRVKRYEQMREACNKYYTAENWITETAWRECCATSSPDRPNNIGCDLDSGTPGHYYMSMAGSVGTKIRCSNC